MTIFYIEQALLALQSGSIAGKTAIGANDPVAGDDDRYGIAMTGLRHCPRRLGPTRE